MIVGILSFISHLSSDLSHSFSLSLSVSLSLCGRCAVCVTLRHAGDAFRGENVKTYTRVTCFECTHRGVWNGHGEVFSVCHNPDTPLPRPCTQHKTFWMDTGFFSTPQHHTHNTQSTHSNTAQHNTTQQQHNSNTTQHNTNTEHATQKQREENKR